MQIADAGTRLIAMLADAGIRPPDIAGGDLHKLVRTFRDFASIPASDAAPREVDGDGVLAQWGTFHFRGEEEFQVDLTRQFLEAGDPDDAMLWQLNCTVYYAPSAGNNALGAGSLWSFGLPINQFFAAALGLAGWSWALGSSETPQDIEITFGRV